MPPAKSKSKPGSVASIKTLCAICNVIERKYKCPKKGCGAAYCSVVCYKVHKQTCAEPSISTTQIAKQEDEDSILLTRDGPSVERTTHSSELSSASNPNAHSGNGAETLKTVVEAESEVDADADEQSRPRRSTTPLPPLIPTLPAHSGTRSQSQPPLRTLSSLDYPPEPDPDVFVDPLRMDERERCVERDGWLAIAQSPALRHILSTHPSLKPLLTAIQTRLPTPYHRSHAIAKILGVDEESMMEAMSAGERERRWSEEGFYLEGIGSGGGGGRGGRGGRGSRGSGRGGFQSRGRGGGRFQPYRDDDRNQADDGLHPPRFWIGREEKEALKAFAESVRETLERAERDKNGDRHGQRRVEWEL